jgi:hypothetical protein
MAARVAKKMKLEHEPEATVAMKQEVPNSDEDTEDEAATSAIAQFQSEDVSAVAIQQPARRRGSNHLVIA